MLKLQIVGNKDGNLVLEFEGKPVAIVTDEYFWKDYIDNANYWIQKSKQPFSQKQVEKVCQYIADNVMNNIRSWELESVITDSIYQCQDEYIENHCDNNKLDDEDEDE